MTDDLSVAGVDEQADVVPRGPDAHVGQVAAYMGARRPAAEAARDDVGHVGLVDRPGVHLEPLPAVCADQAVLPHIRPSRLSRPSRNCPHQCSQSRLKTYYIKATELRDRFQKAVQRGNTSRVVSSLVKPSCLIVDEVGRCVYDRPCTDLVFDVVDRRYEKEGPNAMVLTSNIAPSGWDEFFAGDDTLLCALDRLFDKASVFVMRGPSYRGRGLDTYSVEAVPQAVKVRGIQPEGM